MHDDEVKLWARPTTSWRLLEECGSNPPSLIKDALLSRSWEAWTGGALVESGPVAPLVIAYAI